MKARGQPQAQLDPGAEATLTEVYLFQRQLGFLWGAFIYSQARPLRASRGPQAPGSPLSSQSATRAEMRTLPPIGSGKVSIRF